MKYFALEYVVSEEDAENIVQDVFTELWEKKEILAYDVNLVALLFTSIKNRCIDLLRHRIVVKEAVNLIQEEYQAGKRATILFDGAMSHANVYINGQKVGYWPYGYNSFHFDITKYLKPGKNTVAIHVLKYSDGYYLEGQDYWRLAGIFDDVLC